MQHQLMPVVDLNPGDRTAMFDLLQTHFAGVHWDTFNADLAAKNWVILLHDPETGHLKGFSTLLLYHAQAGGDPISVVYSGDTIMDPSAWHSATLARAWINAVNQLRDREACGRLYWLLISSGYRTYRFLPVFWQEFYPRYDRPTPPARQDLMAQLAEERFGTSYDRDRGIVRLPQPQRLKGRLQGIPPERLSDPHIRFFAQQNPGHANGDELVCLTEICAPNLTAAGRRMWFGARTAVPV